MDARSPGGIYRNMEDRRRAWDNNDDRHNSSSQQRYIESIHASRGRETGPRSDRHSETTEQEMDVDNSDDTRREKMPVKNIEELFLKLEGLPTLIQNSKQEMRAWKQLLSTRVSDDTLKLKQVIEKLTMENQALKDPHHNRISSSRNDEKIKELEQELQKAKEISDKYKDAYSEVIGEYKKAVTKIKTLEQTVADAQHNLDKIKRECESVKGQMSTLQNRYKAANDEKVKIEKELSESKTRLSRMMGNKLGDNNPDLADLSDKNRPTKIAEKYTELYDNEWTDAFEVCLTESGTENQAIETLLQMLQDAKEACDRFAKEQGQKLKEAVKMNQVAEHLPEVTLKHMKDFRRFTAEESLPGVLEKCLSAVCLKSYARLLRHKDMLPFFKGCVELCWFMNVQDPPLAFGDTPTRNQPFDTNIFKFYTATGSYFDFMVWPVLHLTKDGALLTKGVAQACSGHQPEWQSHENRQAKSSRSKEISYPFVYSRQVVSPAQNVDHHGIQSNHDNNKSSPDQMMQNVQNKNYEQFVVDKSDHTSDKTKLFSQTVKQRVSTSVADRMTKNFGSSHRHYTSDTYIKQDLKPSRPELNVWSKFKGLIKFNDINGQEMRKCMGKDYESCIAYYNYLYGNKSTESDV